MPRSTFVLICKFFFSFPTAPISYIVTVAQSMSTLAGCWLIVTSGALLGVTAAFLWTAQEDTIKLWREQLKRTWCRDSLRVLYYIKVRRRVYQAFFFDALMFRFSVRTLAEITASEITSIPRFREFCGVEDVLFAGYLRLLIF
jgi:hypothetical protein